METPDQPRFFRTWQGFRGAQGADFRMVCRPAARFSRLARLSRSAGSRFSHGLPTSPAFFAYLAWCITLLLSFVLNYSHILQRGQRCGAVRRSFRSNFIANSCGAHRLNNSASRKRKATIFELYFYTKHWLSHQRFDTIETQRSTKCQKNLLQILKTN